MSGWATCSRAEGAARSVMGCADCVWSALSRSRNATDKTAGVAVRVITPDGWHVGGTCEVRRQSLAPLEAVRLDVEATPQKQPCRPYAARLDVEADFDGLPLTCSTGLLMTIPLLHWSTGDLPVDCPGAPQAAEVWEADSHFVERGAAPGPARRLRGAGHTPCRAHRRGCGTEEERPRSDAASKRWSFRILGSETGEGQQEGSTPRTRMPVGDRHPREPGRMGNRGYWPAGSGWLKGCSSWRIRSRRPSFSSRSIRTSSVSQAAGAVLNVPTVLRQRSRRTPSAARRAPA